MIFWELFITFCKIGFTSFGGLSMVPLINSEMLGHGWMTATEVSDIVAIAEMTPGPLGLNCAIFAGTRTAGLLGALCAVLGVTSPTLLLCSLAAVAFERFKDSRTLGDAMVGVRPASLGLLIGVLISLCSTNYVNTAGAFSPAAALIGVLAVVMLFVWKQSISLTILACALAGLVLIR